jgi:DNA end-binding protein Ku
MAGRAYWKGYLKLSLVSCPIALTPATSDTERVKFRTVNKETGNRIRYQFVDDVTREEVPPESRGKGYEVAKGEDLVLDDGELEAIELESAHTIDIDSFVPASQIDKRFYDTPYYISPNDNVGQDAFAVIRNAMRGKGMAALGRIVMSKRERVIAVEPHGKGLLGTTLHYPYEVRKAEEYFEDIPDVKLPDEMLKLAEHILETKRADFDPSTFRDHYEEELVKLLKKKQAGWVPSKTGDLSATSARNVVNLMDALRRSIATDGPPRAESRKPVASSNKRNTLRRNSA